MQMESATPSPRAQPSGATYDSAEVERFSRIAEEWWDPDGKFRPLHKLGPARLRYVRDRLLKHFGRPSGGLTPLQGLTLLDVGCGGGLLAEPLARMGGLVTAIDPSPENIAAARAHAVQSGIQIGYRACRLEDLVAESRQFDAVCCLEVLEHIPDPGAFVALCAKAVRPGGLLILSTINRTWKSYALAIVAAEYVLGWLPRGTHQWDRFVTTEELSAFTAAAGLGSPHFEGLVFDPLRDSWGLSSDTDVNFMASAARSA